MTTAGLIRSFADSIAGVLAPRKCLVCGWVTEGDPAAEEFICPQCIDRIPHAPAPEDIRSRMLTAFGRDELRLRRVCALISLSDNFDYMEIIHSLKYHGISRAAEDLGQLLARRLRLEGMDDYDWIIPVPIHLARLRERGYNQSEIIARGIVREIVGRVRPDIIRRHIYTSTQTTLSAGRRRENVAAAFSLLASEDVAGRRILLVDDVLTTGSTLNACAACLDAAGPEFVDAAVIARA
ncbi:MAG: ComF family protein [Candidatus Kapaibacterium sp.]